MRLLIKSFLVIIIVFNIGCKKNIILDYKYENKEDFLNCEIENKKLLKEALYSFENDLKLYYDWNNRNIYKSYAIYIYRGIDGNIDFQNMISPHTIYVFEKLKNIEDLWTKDHKLNYESDLIKCIASNIKDDSVKTVLNSFLSINGMNRKVFGPTLISNYNQIIEDRQLAMYVALDLFYAHLFDIDTEQIKEKVLNKYGVYVHSNKKED